MRLWISLLALLCAGCMGRGQILPDDTPETPNQAAIMEYVHAYAAQLDVRVDRVRFVTFQHRAWEAAWADCKSKSNDQQWLSFVTFMIEPLGDMDLRIVAAHEVCHVYNGDTLRCGQGDDAEKERLATACEKRLTGRP